MCWNWQVSIASFLLICSVSHSFYKRNSFYERNNLNDRILAFFILSYGSIQLFETFMWIGLNIKL